MNCANEANAVILHVPQHLRKSIFPVVLHPQIFIAWDDPFHPSVRDLRFVYTLYARKIETVLEIFPRQKECV